MTYVITGATGHIGGAIANALLAQGKPIRVVGRDAAKLKPFTDRGAQAVVGDLGDAAVVTKALTGATAAFLMVPPNYGTPDFRAYQNAVGASFATAIRAAGLPPVVFLSSLGAHQSYDVGPIKGLYDVEQRLNAVTGIRAVHLRPTYFFENHLSSIGLIAKAGINGSPGRGDVAIPMIATTDIAAAAAGVLVAGGWQGVSARELHGPRDYTLTEATRILGTAIGKPDLPYVQFPEADAIAAMVGAGLTPDLASQYAEMYRVPNRIGQWPTTVLRSPATTTATTLESWATTVFAPAFAAARA